jgi:hypothetical protein
MAESTKSTPLLQVALKHLKRFPGHHLFPIKPGDKAQPLASYKKQASNDPATIRRWAAYWWRRHRWDVWWGVEPSLSGLVPADIDTKAGKHGQDTFDLFEMLYGWPPTLESRTPSGGRHRWHSGRNLFHIGAPTTAHPDIDFPAYIILPGCGKYQWTNGLSIAPAPEWFYVEANRRDQSFESVAQEPVVELDTASNVAWAKQYLERDAPPAVQGQNGDMTTMNVAGVLKDHGISEQAAFDLMWKFYNNRCIPPWDIGPEGYPCNHLDVKVANAYRYLKDRAPGECTAEYEFADDDPEFETAEDQQRLRTKNTIERDSAASLIDGETFPVVRTQARRRAS